MIVGTTLNQVQPCLASRSQNCDAEKRCGATTLPPCTIGPSVATIWPLMWYSGSDESTRSPAPSACACCTWSAPETTFLCVSRQPLGFPVVPEVYISSAGSSSAGAAKSPP